MPLDDDWSELLPKAPTPTFQLAPEDLDLEAYVRIAADKAEFDVKHKVPKEVIGAFQQKFVENLTRDLREAPLDGLLKYVLESRGLSVSELRTFVQVLPLPLLKRLLATAVGKTGSGIHLLLALEVDRRERNTRYEMEKLPSGALQLRFNVNGEWLVANLSEMFEVPKEETPAPAPSTLPSQAAAPARPAQNISRSRPFEAALREDVALYPADRQARVPRGRIGPPQDDDDHHDTDLMDDGG